MNTNKCDFNSYFNTSNKSNNVPIKGSALLSKLADVIAKQPMVVAQTMSNSGISISPTANAKTIVDKIFSEGQNNDKFHKNISKLVMLNDAHSNYNVYGADGGKYTSNAPTGIFDHYDDEGQMVDKNGNYINIPPAATGFWHKLASAFKSIFQGYISGANTTDSIIGAIRPISENYMSKQNSDALLAEIKPTLQQYTYGATLDNTIANLRPITNKYLGAQQSTVLLADIKPFLQNFAPATTPPPADAAAQPTASPAAKAPVVVAPLIPAKAQLTQQLKDKGVDMGMSTISIVGISLLAVSAIGLTIYLIKKYKKNK